MKSPLGLEARLPVFDLFKDSLFLLWTKRTRLISMFLPLILILVVLDHFSTQLQAEMFAAFEQATDTNPAVFEKYGRMIFFGLTSMLLSVLLATTVHRFSLQDPSQWPLNALRVPTRYDLKYLLRSIVVVLASAFVGGIAVMMASVVLASVMGPEEAQKLSVVVAVPCLMLMIYVMARLSVTLPEIAIGTEGSDLGRAWRMSQGNGSRLVIVVLALPLLVSSPFILLANVGNTVTDIIAAFGVYFMTLISITVLSLSYQFLVEFYEPQEDEQVVAEDNKDDSGMDA
ncbi:hypothetical protein [uncultured Thalassolituus sp.]|uniref:hypothetical protein n=1 Tax=uncultured Thalassolituus sp. TaxID=285273 RepID=UPI002603BD78|nr:hypothetical protein [uncultured Thalassolituus sp.]